MWWLLTLATAVAADTPAEASEAPVPLQVKSCEAPPRALPADFETVLNSVVTLKSPDGGLGSGTLISPDGFVLTAAHVVDGGADTVRLRVGAELGFDVIRMDRARDLALLRTKGSSLPCLPLSSDAGIGITVWAVGTPLAQELELSVAKGIISGVRKLETARLLQTDAALSPGYSGGPLLSETGLVLGVISFKASGGGAEGLGFAVSVDEAADRLGLRFGATSDATTPWKDPADAKQVAQAASEGGGVQGGGGAFVDFEANRKKRARRQVWAGVGMLVAGAITTSAATVAWTQGENKTAEQAGTLRAIDIAGVTAAVAGGTIAVTGLLAL